MTVMRTFNSHKIWFATFLLLICAAGCSDPEKGTNATVTAPAVGAVTPPKGMAGACPSTPVTVTFSKPMNPSSINATTFTVTPATAGAITHDTSDTVFTFTPSSSLALNTTYT